MNRYRLMALVALFVPIAAANIPLALYLPALYATNFGMPLATTGAVFLFGRLWDAVSDPMIGTLSDRTRTRFGRRRPWIAAGLPVFGVATYLLFFPPWRPTALSLGLVLFVFYLGWTMIQLPLYAWMGEISGHYHERTRIVGYGQLVASTSLLLILLIPAIIDRVNPGDQATKLAMMGAFILATLLPSAALTLFSNREPVATDRVAASPIAGAGALLRNALLMKVLASDFAVTVGQGMRASLFLFFVTFYVGRPDLGGILFLAQVGFGVLAAPLWTRIGILIGKHRAVVAGEVIQMTINLALLFVMPGSIGLLLALTLAQGLAQGSGNLMLRAIVADVADDHRLRTGHDQTGLMFSIFSLSGKVGTAVAIGVALPLVAWLGFDPRSANGADDLLHLKLVFTLGPALAHALSAILVSRFPLDEARYRRVRAELDAKDLRLRDAVSSPAADL